mmetsp:Transcript_46767/g.100122  ORF Transcript_46767/g.100122 Transcript_46767/m.100122 type:complete len:750 (-) Transcript_46767:98-2347(-)
MKLKSPKTSGASELTTDLTGLLSDEEDDSEEAKDVHHPFRDDAIKDLDELSIGRSSCGDNTPTKKVRRSSSISSFKASMKRTNSQTAMTGSLSVDRRKSLPASPKRSASTPRLEKRHTMSSTLSTGTLISNSSPPDRPKGDVSVCVRLRPGPRHEMCLFAETANCVRLRPVMPTSKEDIYWCDYAFGPASPQEKVFNEAVGPICESVLEGYNGAVIAYGQTGSGKTYTIIGDPATENTKGVIPRSVELIFEGLQRRKHWSVEVSVLEIYNEKTRDLLSPTPGVQQVDIHEVTGPGTTNSDGVPTFHCPDATQRSVRNPEDALKALFEGLKRRETARTDMNHNSSRSHLIFTLTTTQSDDALKATLRGRLHLVDLAGCERLKRSMGGVGDDKTPRERDTQRREAGAINKSLTQLALVIFRLTQPSSAGLRHVPYRDSMLTRLLADSFGGSSKTCLIINCSPSLKDREETRCALEFGKRANLVKNVAEINIEMQEEPSEVVKALVEKKLAEFKREREELRNQTRQAALDALSQQRKRLDDVKTLEREKAELETRLEMACSALAEARENAQTDTTLLQERNALLRTTLEAMVEEAARAHNEKLALQRQLLMLLQQGAREDAGNPSKLEDARALIAESEDRYMPVQSNKIQEMTSDLLPRLEAPLNSPAGSNSSSGANGNGVNNCNSNGSASNPNSGNMTARVSTIEEELRSMQNRWADVLAQPSPAAHESAEEEAFSFMMGETDTNQEALAE